MRRFRTPEEEKLAELVRQAEIAKLEQHKDRFNLPPVGKGILRGRATGVHQSEQACEYGTLRILEFELTDTEDGVNVPVRMTGTYFNSRVQEGVLVDVPDPPPNIRPLAPYAIVLSRSGGRSEVRSHYPGRGDPPRRRSVVRSVLVLIVPVVLTLAILAALYYYRVLK